MSRKKLVVSGDSWTAGVHQRPFQHQRQKNGRGRPIFLTDPAKNVSPAYTLWPKYLADMLGMDVINVGLGGRGNEFIYNHIIDKLSSVKNVGLTIVMWSDQNRWDFVGNRTLRIDPSILDPFKGQPKKIIDRYRPVFDAIKDANLVSTEYNFLKSLRWYNAFQNYCVNENISYMQCSGFNEIDRAKRNDIISTIIDHPVFYKINENNFYGWPIFHEIGGFTLNNKVDEIDPEGKKFRVSDEDNHPNTEGHKFIAELLYNHYVKLYARPN